VVEVVLEEVVLGEVLEVCVLNEGQVCVCKDADIHGCGGLSGGLERIREGCCVVNSWELRLKSTVTVTLKMSFSPLRSGIGPSIRGGSLNSCSCGRVQPPGGRQ
jgi:hypothetical protein